MLSVCLATYNGSKYIKGQIESILPQLSPEDELIVSDDASTDETSNTVLSINDNRIRLVTNESVHGITGNFENAINLAKGDYVFLSDQDDKWLPNKVGLFMAEFKKGADIVLSNSSVTDSHLNVKIKSCYDAFGHPNLSFFGTLKSCGWQGSAMALKRDVLLQSTPFPHNKYILHDLWIGLTVGQIYNTHIIYTPTLLYRRHSSTVTPLGLSETGEQKHSANTIRFKITKRIVACALSSIWHIKHTINLLR